MVRSAPYESVIKPGQRVSAFTMMGGFAERVVVAPENVVPTPDGVDDGQAAALLGNYYTMYFALARRGALRHGETVLVLGSGGGIGTASIQIAKALGARVIVTSSSTEKLERARELGADGAFNHDTDDVVAEVKELTEGGAHVVIDHVGEATWKRTLDAARPLGRVCVCGATTGPNPPANLHRIWWKQLTVFGSTVGTTADFEAVYELVKSGRAVPVIDEVLPLAEAAEAHERLEAGQQLGKIVLRIHG